MSCLARICRSSSTLLVKQSLGVSHNAPMDLDWIDGMSEEDLLAMLTAQSGS